MRRLSASDIEALATAAFGEPNTALGKAGEELRIGRRGSVTVNLRSGRFRNFETDESGGLHDLIVRAGEARDLLHAGKWLRDFSGERDWRPSPRPQKVAAGSGSGDNIARACQLFRNAQCLSEGTPAEAYLRRRAIDPPYPASLRYGARTYNSGTRSYLPALLAAVSPLLEPGTITAVHRTYLSRDGRKADVATPKKTLGSVLSGGVILARFTGAILVGEGIETTMSASGAFNIPGVATLGTSGMRRLIVPATVMRVVIAYDIDPTSAGRHAAEHLARRLWAQGVEVQFAPPPGNFNDWNDAAQSRAKRHKD